MNKTDIEYLATGEERGFTWNPVTGCTPCGPGCADCWAKRMAETRLRGRCGYAADDPFKVTFHPDRLEEPLKLRKSARIGVCYMGDLFHEDMKPEWLAQIMDVMSSWKHNDEPDRMFTHTYLVLTKRPQNVMPKLLEAEQWADRYFPGDTAWNVWRDVKDNPIPNNIHLGVTVCNQAEADEKIPQLLRIPAAVRWISYEPALAPIEITRHLIGYEENGVALGRPAGTCIGYTPPLDWIVAGCEKLQGGRPGRPTDPEWFRLVRDQCRAAGVPFYMKQMRDPKTGRVTSDMADFPEDLRIREVPEVKHG